MSKGVQFRGIGQIIIAFENMKLPKWAVKYDKGIVCKFEGNDLTESSSTLKEFLKMLEKSRSESQYTLNVYEDLAKNAKIKPSTEADYTFYFLVFEEEGTPYAIRTNNNQQIIDKLTALEARLAIMDAEEEEEPEKVGGVLGMINGFLDDPRVKDKIVTGIMGFVENLMKKPAPVLPIERQIGAVGAITDDSPVLIDQAEHNKLQAAINVLVKVDGSLGTNLQKIAAVAAADPAKYMQMISMLNTFLA
jgi:hypothetical protein